MLARHTKEDFMPAITTGLAKDKAQTAIKELQPVLFDLIGLYMQTKQLHWNVVGPRFKMVHEQLDAIAAALQTHTDEIAERIVTLGQFTEATPRNVSEKSRIAELPRDFVTDSNAISLLADRLLKSTSTFRTHQEKLGDVDPISEDMLIGVISDLEKHSWMLQAQQS
jgi:starvation-inducible DNA-binding protein